MEEQLHLPGEGEDMELQESEGGDPVMQSGETMGAKGIGEKTPKEEPNDGVHCTNTPEGSKSNQPSYISQAVKEQQHLLDMGMSGTGATAQATTSAEEEITSTPLVLTSSPVPGSTSTSLLVSALTPEVGRCQQESITYSIICV